MSRRGENIYRRVDGRWEARYIVGHDPLSGKAKYGYVYAHSYRRARELKHEANRLQRKTENEQEATVEQCLREWLDAKERRGELRTSTLQLYRRQIRYHILPVLGDCRISRLTESVLEEYRSEKRKNGRLDGQGGLSPAVTENLMRILYAMLQYEWEKGKIAELPRKKAVCARGAKRTVQGNCAFSEEEQKKIESVLYEVLKRAERKQGIYMGILFAFYTGLRVGELGGLRWKDVDLYKATVSVCRTLQRIAAPDENGSILSPEESGRIPTPGQEPAKKSESGREPSKRKTVLQLGAPKSESSRRSFPVKEEMIAILRKYKKSLPKERTEADQPVFTTETGRCVEPRLFQKYFTRLLEQAGVEKKKFHALRHTFATRCVENNMDIQSLSECLGHSSSQITLRVYAHSFTEQKRRCMERLAFKCDIQAIEKAEVAYQS